jgi:hypothetical protein
VLQAVPLGSPPVAHTAFASNIFAFVLQPQISGAITLSVTQLSFAVNPIAKAGQRAVLLLNEATDPPPLSPAAYSFALPPLAADSPTLAFPIAGAQAATTYFMRVQLDGAESPVNFDRSSVNFGPTVSFP